MVSKLKVPDLTRREFMAYSGRAAGAAILLSTPIIAAACGTESATGVFRYGALEIFDSPNVLTTVSAPDMHWLIYDRLMEFDQNLSPQLAMAESREVSADGLTVTYTLREGVKFSDGEDLTSADVKFSWELIRDEELSIGSPFLQVMTSIDTPDDRTVVAHFISPPTLEPATAAPIVPQHIWGGMSRDQIDAFENDEMIGSGAFKLVSYTPDERLDLERNDDWWGWDIKGGTVGSLVKVKLANEETMANSLRNNEIDITAILATDIWESLRDVPNIVAQEYPALILDHFGINVYEDPANPGQPHPDSGGNPLLLDQRVREAMSWAMDRDRLVELVLGGRGQRGSMVLFPAFADAFLDLPDEEQANNDPERARQILEDAGYTDRGDGIRANAAGEALSFRLFASTVIDRLPKYAELIKPMLEAVGMEIEGPIGEDDPTLINRVFVDADWDMYTWVWGSFPDPTFMLSINTCAQFGNLSDTYYCNAEYEALFEAQQLEPDPVARAVLLKDAQRLFYNDFAYCVMAYPVRLHAYRTDNLTNWQFVNNGPVQQFQTDNYLMVQEV